MKPITYLFLIFTLFVTACGSDDEQINQLTSADLQYDDDNFSAPILPSGTHIAAARFTPTQLGQYVGQNLTEVLFYLQEVPASCILTIREEGTDSSPGTTLYTADISSSVGPNGWNQHTITLPIPISESDLWICIEVVHQGDTRSVGCDPGPAQANGDWLLSDTSLNDWETLRNYTDQEVNINWNIRGRVN